MVELYTAQPADSTVICAGVLPRPEKTWVYGGLRVADGQAITMCASSHNSAFHQDFRPRAEQANPEGTLYVITDNLSGHDSKSTRARPEDHPVSGTPSFPRDSRH